MARVRRLLELEATLQETSRWHWLDDLIQTRGDRFLDSLSAGPLGQDWVFLCESGELATPGDFFTDEIAGRLVVTCRDRKRNLQGFFNVCPHLGAAVERKKRGNRRAFVCPYHGWSFHLNGELADVPLPGGYDEHFNKADYPLHTIRTTEVGGLMFGSLAEFPKTPEDFFSGPEQEIKTLFPDNAQRQVIFDASIRVDMGWREWMKQSREDWSSGRVAAALTGLSGEAFSAHSEVRVTEQSHQITLIKALDADALGRRYGMAFAQNVSLPIAWADGGYVGAVLHLAPTLIAAHLGGALITLRADPITDTVTLLRVRGYGERGESAATRLARMQYVQTGWGPYSDQYLKPAL